MNDPVILTQVGLALAALGQLLAWWRIRRDDKQKIDEMFAKQADELHSFKLQVALTHPTSTELANLRADVMGAINRLTERIDRLLERDE